MMKKLSTDKKFRYLSGVSTALVLISSPAKANDKCSKDNLLEGESVAECIVRKNWECAIDRSCNIEEKEVISLKGNEINTKSIILPKEKTNQATKMRVDYSFPKGFYAPISCEKLASFLPPDKRGTAQVTCKGQNENNFKTSSSTKSPSCKVTQTGNNGVETCTWWTGTITYKRIGTPDDNRPDQKAVTFSYELLQKKKEQKFVIADSFAPISVSGITIFIPIRARKNIGTATVQNLNGPVKEELKQEYRSSRNIVLKCRNEILSFSPILPKGSLRDVLGSCDTNYSISFINTLPKSSVHNEVTISLLTGDNMDQWIAYGRSLLSKLKSDREGYDFYKYVYNNNQDEATLIGLVNEKLIGFCTILENSRVEDEEEYSEVDAAQCVDSATYQKYKAYIDDTENTPQPYWYSQLIADDFFQLMHEDDFAKIKRQTDIMESVFYSGASSFFEQLKNHLSKAQMNLENTIARAGKFLDEADAQGDLITEEALKEIESVRKEKNKG